MKAKYFFTCTALLMLVLNSQAGESNQLSNQSQILFSQQPAEQSFGYFRVHRMGRDASLNWGVSDPSVAYFVIERSYNGSFFEVISNIAGTGEATYKFRDEACFPGFIYYRITAHNTDGSVTVSDVETLHIVAKK